MRRSPRRSPRHRQINDGGTKPRRSPRHRGSSSKENGTKRKSSSNTNGRSNSSRKRPRENRSRSSGHGAKKKSKGRKITKKSQDVLAKQEAGFLKTRIRQETKRFLCDLKFHTELPNIPFEPKFINQAFNKDEISKYGVTTLEKGYDWKLHAEADLGIHIDLIDLDKLKVPDIIPEMHPVDRELCEDESRTNNPLRSSRRQQKTWLQKTIYINNNLLDQVHNNATRIDILKKKKQLLEKSLATHTWGAKENERDKISRILDSFKAVEVPTCELRHPTKKGKDGQPLKALKSWPLVPNRRLWPNTYSQVTFELYPMHGLGGNNKNVSVEEQQNRCSQGLLRAETRGDQDGVYGGFYVPKIGENGKTTEVAPGAGVAATSTKKQEFARIRDYGFYVSDAGLNASSGKELFLLSWDPNSVDGTLAEYTMVSSRVLLNRRPPTNAPIDWTLETRPLNEKETAARAKELARLEEDQSGFADSSSSSSDESEEDMVIGDVDKVSTNNDTVENKETPLNNLSSSDSSDDSE